MKMPPTKNVYLPKTAMIYHITDEIEEVKTFYWHFLDHAEQESFRFRPGQFAHISLFGFGDFPASLPPSPTEDETFFTIRRVGTCTAALHDLKAGDMIGVRGPFGNGFPMTDYHGKSLVFVAGGIGLIPLRSCIVYALANREQYDRILIFYGSKSSKELMYLSNLREWEKAAGVECFLTVDNADSGWDGNVGVVGSLFKKPGVQIPVDNTVAFVCGPPVMFRFVIKDLLDLGFQENAIVSTMERYMKCGVGKCGHCCIGVSYVCTEGPVFTYDRILELGELI